MNQPNRTIIVLDVKYIKGSKTTTPIVVKDYTGLRWRNEIPWK